MFSELVPLLPSVNFVGDGTSSSLGVWQGVALHYAIKTGFGIIVSFGSANKLFIELNSNFILHVSRYVIVGIPLGVLFSDFLYQYFEEPRHLSDRIRKKHQSAPTPVTEKYVRIFK